MIDVRLDWLKIRDAARRLERGELVAFPTETVYGLGADAENPCAVTYIYKAKGRPSNHPVIVHVAPEADLSYWTADVPEDARKLIAAFWPGPLTLTLKRAAHISNTVSGGQDSIGIRCPSHPVAQALLRTFKEGKGGLAAPSANRFGHVSPTTAQHVRDEFGVDNPLVKCVLEGGQSEVGIESTIVDLSRRRAVLLRPGHVSLGQLEAMLGYAPTLPDAEAPRTSGTLNAHYAPATPVVLVALQELAQVLYALKKRGCRTALMYYTDATSAQNSVRLSSQADAYAHDLYAALRAMDQTNSELIVVEAPPQGEAWRSINDRLRRAAHNSVGILERLLK